MSTRWRRGLSFLVSASMVLGMVPAPALAEAIEEAQPEEVFVQDEAPPEEENAEQQEDILEVESIDDGDATAQTDEDLGVDEKDDEADESEPPILTTQSDDDTDNLGGGYWELRWEGTSYVEYTGAPVAPEGIGVYHGHGYEDWDDYAALAEGTHYELVYYTAGWDEEGECVYTEVGKPSDPGTYYVAARHIEGGGYSGETDKRDFVIEDRVGLGGGYWELRWEGTSYVEYTGAPVAPEGIGVYHGLGRLRGPRRGHPLRAGVLRRELQQAQSRADRGGRLLRRGDWQGRLLPRHDYQAMVLH